MVTKKEIENDLMTFDHFLEDAETVVKDILDRTDKNKSSNVIRLQGRMYELQHVRLMFNALFEEIVKGNAD